MAQGRGIDARTASGTFDQAYRDQADRDHEQRRANPPRFVARAARFVAGLGLALSALTVAAAAAPAHAERAGTDQLYAATAEGREYLARLLHEINHKRASIGARPLAYAGGHANAAVDRYLADLAPMMQAYNACFHGTGYPVRPGWDYTRDAGVDVFPRGEVLACPDSEADWTPEYAAERWWRSPGHAQILYADGDAGHIACGVYGQRRGKASYTTVACVTFD